VELPLAVWWSRIAFWSFAAALVAAAPSLRNAWRDLPAAVRRGTWAIAAAGVVLRLVVVPFTVFRSEYALYSQLQTDLALLDDIARPPWHVPGRGALFEFVSTFVPLTYGVVDALNVAAAALSIVVAGFCAYLLTGRTVAGLACSALLAFDPVHARLTGDGDVTQVMGLGLWVVLAGVLTDLRRASSTALLLSAAAAAWTLSTKLDAAFPIAGVGLLFVATRGAPRTWLGVGRRRLAAVAGAAGMLVASLLVIRSIARADASFHAGQLSFTAAQHLQWLEDLPGLLFAVNPFVHAAYTPMAVPFLAVVGLVAGFVTLGWRAFAWIPATYLLVVYRVFFNHVDWASEEAMKGNLRWLFHGHLPWFLAAAIGVDVVVRWLPRYARAVVPAAVLLSTLPTADFWTHRWTLQREHDFVRARLETAAPPCAVMTAWKEPVPYNPTAIFEGLGPLTRWRGVPVAHPDALPAGASLTCAEYFEGLGCYVRRGDPPDDFAKLRPACAAIRARFELVPIQTLDTTFEQFCGHPVRQTGMTFGFYRLVAKSRAP